MRTRRADCHLAALAIARECVQLGATRATVCAITGLKRSLVSQIFLPGKHELGLRPPLSVEWLYRRNMTAHVHASVLAAIFSDLVERGVPLANALTGAFRLYLTRAEPMRDRFNTLDFNRAFVTVRYTFGLWGAPQEMRLMACRNCSHRYIDSFANLSGSSLCCPLCKLRERCATDSRVRAHMGRLCGDPASARGAKAVSNPVRRVRRRAVPAPP